MMQLKLVQLFISGMLLMLVCFASTWIINPTSIINFIGPSAALVSGLLLIWGVTPIIAVLIFSPIIAFSLQYFFHLEVSLAIMLISIQAIILQGIWTKQLVFHFVENKNWLSSRKKLLAFLLRIGPLASLASASSVVIITMLDNQVIQGSFFYTFVNTWAASMLLAVFFIPLILLIKNAEKFKLTKRIYVALTSFLGGLAILLVLKTSQFQQQSDRQADFKQAKDEVERLVLTEIDVVVKNINSLSAFFSADRHVSPLEFKLFSESIFSENSSVRALEWAPIIKLADRKAFEEKKSEYLKQPFYIKERSRIGRLDSAKRRSQYAPLSYIFPEEQNQAALGLDIFTNPKRIISMEKVVLSQQLMASAPITLVQDERAIPAILFSRAVFSNESLFTEPHSTEFAESAPETSSHSRELSGFVVAVAQFDEFFQRTAKYKKSQVNFVIKDISNREPFILFGHSLQKDNRFVDTIDIPVFSRMWQIEIAEKNPWFSQSKSWQAWAVLFGGTLGAALFQMLVLMMAAYSSELSAEVEHKTRALITAKESSEQKNLAKSDFLQTLNGELRMPLLAIKTFIEQLKGKGLNNKEITGIAHAGNNVTLLLDTMMDLSNIESGKVIPKIDCFDFYGFLQRTESLLKASTAYEGKSIMFLIDDSVPHYLNSDELYIHKLINTLIESAHHLLNTEALRLSIKLHRHQLAEASLFFTLSSQDDAISEASSLIMKPNSQQALIADRTVMAMALKYSQLLQGDIHMGTLNSGAGVLSASIRVSVSSIEEQEAQQGLTFDLI